jgi:PAS domain S-box-containing protein
MAASAAHDALRKAHVGARFTVFREHRVGNGDVIIKQDRSRQPELRGEERLRHEFEILRALTGSSVSRPIELTTIDGIPSLVLEDAGSTNLVELLSDGPLGIDTFFDLAIEMSRIVSEIHAHGVIHRDICPENFVLDETSRRLTLVDFESATMVPAFAERPGTPGKLEGTLAYMAPEQTGRLRRLVDRRADLYSLGATFYALLTGLPPFSSLDPLELVHAHAARAPYPPAVVRSDVPTVISDLVIKLLSKAPEWRYQTAEALAADLEDARAQRQTRGRIDLFELGRRDLPYGLFLETDKLYGRDRDERALTQAFDRVRRGASEVVLISGPAGIGKSALVNHLESEVLGHARWLTGKGDLLRGNVAYAPIVEVLREWVRLLSSEPEDVVARLSLLLREATAPNAHLLIEAFPDLEPLLGEERLAPSVGAVEDENRFRLAFSALIRVLVSNGPPLVLFLDDLQWFDPASLELLHVVAIAPELRPLLIVCAFRSEELDDPQLRTLSAIRTESGRVSSIDLGPLDSDALIALLCDALRVEPAKAASLAEAVQKKTASNPFFVRRFLGYLYQEQLLVFDAKDGRWAWDAAMIDDVEVTQNVVEFSARLIATLPEDTRIALQAAACIGNRFELGLVAAILQKPVATVAQLLWPLAQHGLVVPALEGPRFAWAASKPAELETAVSPAFRFAHDRFQQAAYGLLSDEERSVYHLSIGRWLEAHAPEDVFDAAIGAIADQLDRATDRLTKEEQIQLADLNARAGLQARSAAAHVSALGYFRAGLRLLPDMAWKEEHHALWFTLLRNAAECAGLSADYALSDALVDEGIARTEAVLERAELYSVAVETNALRGTHARAIERAKDGLLALGIDLPFEPSEETLEADCERTHELLARRSEWQLLEAGPMNDPVDRAHLGLLIKLSSAWFVASELFQIVGCRAARLTADKGLAPGSAVALAYYAIGLAFAGDYERAYHFGRVGLRIAERLSSAKEEARSLLCLGAHVAPWRIPLAECASMLRRAHGRGLESGDLEFTAYARANIVFIEMSSGTRLDQVLAEAESTLTFYRKIQHHSGIPYVQPFAQMIRCLKGLTGGPTSFDDDRYQEPHAEDDAATNGLGQAVLFILKLEASYLHGDLEGAVACTAQAVAWLRFLRTLFLRVDFHFYAALTAAAFVTGKEVREHLGALEIWAANAPMNFGHKRDLVAAELARIEGRQGDALTAYHRAIEEAGRREFTQDEALAHELFARFLRAHGDNRLAELHLVAALDGYTTWGASTKTEQLCREFPTLEMTRLARRLSSTAVPAALDYMSLIKANEALAQELEFESLLIKLVKTCGEVAQAERTVVILDESARVPGTDVPHLVLRASANASEEAKLEDEPLASSPSAPISLIERVFSTKQPLILSDAARDDRSNADPYVAEHAVRSVMAVPIVRFERVLGVLYFENNLTSGAFSHERAELCRLLSAQIAIAIENSRLFEEKKRAQAALRLLSETNACLSETLDPEGVLSKLCDLTVPAFADLCIVDAMENGVLRMVATADRDPQRRALVEELRRRYPVDANSAGPQGQVLRSKQPLLISALTDDQIRTSARDEDHLELMKKLDPRSLIVVPMVARGRSTGVVTLLSSHPTRRFGVEDLALATELVRRSALALDNSRLHRDLSEALEQRKERDRYLRLVFRNMPGTVWAVDRGLNFTHATGRLLNVAGLEAAKLIGKSIYDFLETRDPSNAGIAHHLAALTGERQSFEYQYRGRWYAVVIDPIFDDATEIVGCVGAAFDITEMRDVRERLARSERRLLEAQRVAHVGSFEWEIEPNVLAWSDELQRIYGFEPGQFRGTFEAFMERVPADETDSTRKAIFDAYARLSPFTYDHRILKTDGSLRVLHSRGDVIKDEAGRPVRMVGTCWDITEQKELFRKLEHAVSRWEATLNATAEGIVVADLDGRITSVNKRFWTLWNLEPRDPEGLRIGDLLGSAIEQLEDPEAFLEQADDMYTRAEDESFDEIRFKDDRIFERYSTSQRIGGEIAGRVWSLRDVTERERLLKRSLFLSDATRLLASLDVEQALDGVAHLAVQFFGGGCAIDLFVDGVPRRLVAVSKDARRPISSEIHPTLLGGNSITYRIGSTPHLGVPLVMKGRVIGAITLAATPMHKYRASDLELAEELARRAALSIENARLFRGAQDALRARDEFLAIAAHEIRGPLQTIHLAVQAIRQARVPVEDLPRLLEGVERQDRRLAQLVDELLDVGRIRAGHLHLEYEDVNLGDVVRDVGARFSAELARSGSSLTMTTQKEVVGQWDRSRLDQVVFNLVSNAIKFGRGQPIEIGIDAHDQRAILFVKDRGMGIDVDASKRIFDPFERGVSARHYGGLGLGLYIVKMIVNALGGSVRVESRPDEGATFVVELPQSRGEHESR